MPLKNSQAIIKIDYGRRASHTDLYDQLDVIPFEEMERFLKEKYVR